MLLCSFRNVGVLQRGLCACQQGSKRDSRVGGANLVTADNIAHIFYLISTLLLLLLGELTAAFHFLEYLLRMLLGIFGDFGVCHRSLCKRQSAAVNTKT